MKGLIRIALVLALLVASTAIAIKASGVVTEASVMAYVDMARAIHPAGSSPQWGSSCSLICGSPFQR